MEEERGEILMKGGRGAILIVEGRRKEGEGGLVKGRREREGRQKGEGDTRVVLRLE